MKKFLLLMLLPPLAYTDVVMLEWNIDNVQATEYQILCVFSSATDKKGYQYLKAEKLSKESKLLKADQTFLSDNPPVITQMYQNIDGSSVPIECTRPNK
jgi:hypothetical protein